MSHLSPEPARANREPLLPRQPQFHVSRSQLVDSLLASQSRVRLICAPAGSGKTALMADCARAAKPKTIVWLPLGGRPADPDVLCTRLAKAIDPQSTARDEEALAALLLARTEPLWLMLDDYPREPDAALDACLGRLLALHNQNLYWWLSSRRRPACNLPRLLLENELIELNSSDLWFTRKELSELLRRSERTWPSQTELDLYRESEGWCAGVCFWLIAALDKGQPSAALSHVGLSLVQEYLQRELLDELPTELRTSLLALARLPRFNSELCEYVLGSGEGEQQLQNLLARGAFVQSLPGAGNWYRIAPPVAAALDRRLNPNLALGLHRKACQWFIQQQDTRAAIEQALCAEQPDIAANLLQRYSEANLLYGAEAARIMEWRQKLPQTLLRSTPRLIILHSMTLGLACRSEAEQSLAGLARFLPAPDPLQQRTLLAQWQALHGLNLHTLGLPGSAAEHCQQAFTCLPSDDWSLQQICRGVLIQHQMHLGELAGAERIIAEALQSVREQSNIFAEARVELYRASLLELRGELDAAQALLQLQLQRMSVRSEPHMAPRGRVALQLARLLIRCGQHERARQLLLSGLSDSEAALDPLGFQSHIGLAMLALLEGSATGAKVLLQEAERTAQQAFVSEGVYRCVIEYAQAQLLVLQGECDRAEPILHRLLQQFGDEGCGRVPYGFPDLIPRVNGLLSQVELADGRQPQASRRIEAALTLAGRQGKKLVHSELLLVRAEVELALQQPDAARQTLSDAARESDRMQLQEPLMLLKRYRPALFALLGRQALDSILSDRELNVLQLIAKGGSNQEIGEQLFISVHTVKSHIQRIGGKLGARRRTQLLAKAKALGLLD